MRQHPVTFQPEAVYLNAQHAPRQDNLPGMAAEAEKGNDGKGMVVTMTERAAMVATSRLGALRSLLNAKARKLSLQLRMLLIGSGQAARHLGGC